MTDVRLVENFSFIQGITLDYLLTPVGLLDETEELATLVRVALGTDRLSDLNGRLPDPDFDSDPRGWWADEDAEEIWGGWPIGCNNWQLEREQISDKWSQYGDTVQRAQRYCQEALQPLIDKKIASRMSVIATRNPTVLDRIDVSIVIYRGPLPEIALEFQYLWTQE